MTQLTVSVLGSLLIAFDLSLFSLTFYCKLNRKLLSPVIHIIIQLTSHLSTFHSQGGSLWQQTESAHQLDIIVLDRNLPRSSSELTFSILGAITAAQAQPIRLGWEILDNPNERYPTDADLERGLVDHDAWGAVVIHAGATEALRRARENGDASYDVRSESQALLLST
jgi:hypothetical protein